ncbi:sigma-70 family RNA polymerase sigma factor [Acidiferrobacter thiooxydans]|uniref:sigma-70 family RNA polymerase sigma factor n=1 Tax=Acidiferrobacter thiooxydans TaxID=163359 RepID=UPI0008262B8C|nr:sigma-70 family RNA polymerase sigma factor [Acidiferrobacter thiooxydans]UEO00444.1 sigma-70 family RNA polymerase sigma factor [Acidiferrobacter thiooxydans]
MDKTEEQRRRAAVQTWLEAYGTPLYRYALVRVGQREIAEDLVQETLLGALRTTRPPDGRASEKTWLVGILKHKIVDHLRSRQRSPLDHCLDPELNDGDDIEAVVFRTDGRWREPTNAWGDPLKTLERKAFWRHLTTCLGRLPAAQSEIFALRELEELPMEDVARLAGVSVGNIYVLLHRARLALRLCLQQMGLGMDDVL